MPGCFSVCSMFWCGRVRWQLQTVQLSEGRRFDPSNSRCAHVEPTSLRDMLLPHPLCCNSCMRQKVDPFTIIQLKAERAAFHEAYNTESATRSLKGEVALLLLKNPMSSCCQVAHNTNKQHKATCKRLSFL